MLEVRDLHVFYGAIHALHGVDFEVQKGEIVSLIGANGAGKTTTLHSLSSLVRPKSGSIRFLGQDITGLAPEKIVKAGLIQVPEGRRVFANLTVKDNLLLGAYTRKDPGVAGDLERVFVRFPRLKERMKQISGTLSGGEQQMLAIGRALMARPQLLLLDEPSMGLAPLLVREIFNIIVEINQKDGTTILLVEQNAHMALGISHRAYVLETGKFVLSGPAKELAASEEVRKAYLGG